VLPIWTSADDESSDWRTDTGTPTSVLMLRGTRALRLYPIPTEDGVLTLDATAPLPAVQATVLAWWQDEDAR
jgi:hypothetical protein